MLLTEWVTQVTGVVHRGDASRLPEILRFVYGEAYLVQLRDGRSFEDKDLERVLAMMADEFRVWNTTAALHGGNVKVEGYFPRVYLGNIRETGLGASIGKRKDVSLVVSVDKGWNSALPAPDIESVVMQVREAVTMYSLMGSWDTLNKVNL